MAEPINLDAPTQLPNFLQKWQDLQPVVAQTPQAARAVFGLDLQRLKAGQQPYSKNEVAVGVRTASDLMSHLPAAKPQGILGLIKHLPGAAVSDLEQVVTNIPRIPWQLIEEAKALPSAPGLLAKGIADQSLKEISNVPGIRMLPGSFMVGNLADPSNILKHPVMSALDVAPFLGEGVKLLPEDFRTATRTRLGETLDKFQVGPVSVGTNRVVNVARRQAERSVDEIAKSANDFVNQFSPEEKKVLQNALDAEGEFPYVPPHLEQAFKRVKGYSERLDTIKLHSNAAAMNTIAGTYGTDIDAFFTKHQDEITRVAAQSGADPVTVMRGIARREGLQEFRPNEIMPHLPATEGAPVFVPKAVNEALTRLYNPHIKTGMGKAYDQAIGVFRTAVLPLSLRWHVTNAAGMVAMVGAEVGPVGMMKYWKDAQGMVKNHTLPVELGQPGIFGERGFKATQADAFFDLRKGQDLHNMLNSSQFGDYAAKLGKPLGQVIDKSYRVANLVDHMGTALGYLYGEGKATAKGLTKAEAHQAGVEMAQRVMYDWDAITPVERQIVKAVFPFYGWTKTISKYVMKYPMNHPFRASFVSNLGRAELEDQKSGIPEQYRQLLTFGKKDAEGTQKGFDVKRFNPFSDVASIFTLGGLLGQTNPFINGTLQAIGINRQTGAASAFPQTVFNPRTGRQEAVHKNPLEVIAQNFVPQSNVLFRLLGMESKEAQRLKATNPEAYRMQFWQALGIPAPQNVNMSKIAAQSEIQRFQALTANINAIVKSGDFDKLRAYGPQLGAVADKLDSLKKAGLLDQFTVSKNGVSQLDAQKVFQAIAA